MSQTQKNAQLFDVRCRERNLRNGLITSKDIEAYHASLADSAAKATTLGEIDDARAKQLEESQPAPSSPDPM